MYLHTDKIHWKFTTKQIKNIETKIENNSEPNLKAFWARKKEKRNSMHHQRNSIYIRSKTVYILQSSHSSLFLSRSFSPINRGLKFHYSAERPPAIFPAQPLPDKQRENGSPRTIGPRQETAGIRNHGPNQTERSRTRPRSTKHGFEPP